MDQDRRFTITTFSLIVIFAAILTTAMLYYFGPETGRLARKSGTSASSTLRQFFPLSKEKKSNTTIINPLTGEESTSTLTAGEEMSAQGEESLLVSSKLSKITETAVSGGGFSDLAGTSSPFFVEKSTGHLYRVLPDSRQVERLTNTTLPGTQELYWGRDGKSFRLLLRSIKNGQINNFSGVAQFASSTEAGGIFANSGEIKGRSWTEPITALAVSPNHSQIFTLRSTASGVTGIISGWELKEKKSIFNSGNTEWLVSWPETNTILLVTKPAESLSGFAYLLDTKTGSQKTLLSDIKGLNVLLSPNGQKAFYTESRGTTLRSYLYDLKTQKGSPLSFTTVAEKCVWSSDSKSLFCAVPNVIRSAFYPDVWYRSEISFEDSLWRFTPETGETTMLLNTAESNLSLGGLDATDLFLDGRGRYIFFTHKTDGTFWMFDLN
jgi:hypothetical protein